MPTLLELRALFYSAERARDFDALLHIAAEAAVSGHVFACRSVLRRMLDLIGTVGKGECPSDIVAQLEDSNPVWSLVDSDPLIWTAMLLHSFRLKPRPMSSWRRVVLETLRMVLCSGVEEDERGASCAPELWLRFNLRRESLLRAANFGDAEVLAEQLSQKGALEIVCSRNAAADEATLLQEYLKTAETLRVNVLEALLHAGADPSEVDRSGRNALHFAAARGWADGCSAILAALADHPNTKFSAREIFEEFSSGASLEQTSAFQSLGDEIESARCAKILLENSWLVKADLDEQSWTSSDYALMVVRTSVRGMATFRVCLRHTIERLMTTEEKILLVARLGACAIVLNLNDALIQTLSELDALQGSVRDVIRVARGGVLGILLHFAVAHRRLRCAATVLSSGASPDSICPSQKSIGVLWECRMSYLATGHCAAEFCDDDNVHGLRTLRHFDGLLEGLRNSQWTFEDFPGSTNGALSLASLNADLGMVCLLIRHGASVTNVGSQHLQPIVVAMIAAESSAMYHLVRASLVKIAANTSDKTDILGTAHVGLLAAARYPAKVDASWRATQEQVANMARELLELLGMYDVLHNESPTNTMPNQRPELVAACAGNTALLGVLLGSKHFSASQNSLGAHDPRVQENQNVGENAESPFDMASRWLSAKPISRMLGVQLTGMNEGSREGAYKVSKGRLTLSRNALERRRQLWRVLQLDLVLRSADFLHFQRQTLRRLHRQTPDTDPQTLIPVILVGSVLCSFSTLFAFGKKHAKSLSDLLRLPDSTKSSTMETSFTDTIVNFRRNFERGVTVTNEFVTRAYGGNETEQLPLQKSLTLTLLNLQKEKSVPLERQSNISELLKSLEDVSKFARQRSVDFPAEAISPTSVSVAAVIGLKSAMMEGKESKASHFDEFLGTLRLQVGLLDELQRWCENVFHASLTRSSKSNVLQLQKLLRPLKAMIGCWVYEIAFWRPSIISSLEETPMNSPPNKLVSSTDTNQRFDVFTMPLHSMAFSVSRSNTVDVERIQRVANCAAWMLNSAAEVYKRGERVKWQIDGASALWTETTTWGAQTHAYAAPTLLTRWRLFSLATTVVSTLVEIQSEALRGRNGSQTSLSQTEYATETAAAALFWAARSGSSDVVGTLLRANVSPCAVVCGATALNAAVNNADRETFWTVLTNGGIPAELNTVPRAVEILAFEHSNSSAPHETNFAEPDGITCAMRAVEEWIAELKRDSTNGAARIVRWRGGNLAVLLDNEITTLDPSQEELAFEKTLQETSNLIPFQGSKRLQCYAAETRESASNIVGEVSGEKCKLDNQIGCPSQKALWCSVTSSLLARLMHRRNSAFVQSLLSHKDSEEFLSTLSASSETFSVLYPSPSPLYSAVASGNAAAAKTLWMKRSEASWQLGHSIEPLHTTAPKLSRRRWKSEFKQLWAAQMLSSSIDVGCAFRLQLHSALEDTGKEDDTYGDSDSFAAEQKWGENMEGYFQSQNINVESRSGKEEYRGRSKRTTEQSINEDTGVTEVETLLGVKFSQTETTRGPCPLLLLPSLSDEVMFRSEDLLNGVISRDLATRQSSTSLRKSRVAAEVLPMTNSCVLQELHFAAEEGIGAEASYNALSISLARQCLKQLGCLQGSQDSVSVDAHRDVLRLQNFAASPCKAVLQYVSLGTCRRLQSILEGHRQLEDCVLGSAVKRAQNAGFRLRGSEVLKEKLWLFRAKSADPDDMQESKALVTVPSRWVLHDFRLYAKMYRPDLRVGDVYEEVSNLWRDVRWRSRFLRRQNIAMAVLQWVRQLVRLRVGLLVTGLPRGEESPKPPLKSPDEKGPPAVEKELGREVSVETCPFGGLLNGFSKRAAMGLSRLGRGLGTPSSSRTDPLAVDIRDTLYVLKIFASMIQTLRSFERTVDTLKWAETPIQTKSEDPLRRLYHDAVQLKPAELEEANLETLRNAVALDVIFVGALLQCADFPDESPLVEVVDRLRECYLRWSDLDSANSSVGYTADGRELITEEIEMLRRLQKFSTWAITLFDCGRKWEKSLQRHFSDSETLRRDRSLQEFLLKLCAAPTFNETSAAIGSFDDVTLRSSILRRLELESQRTICAALPECFSVMSRDSITKLSPLQIACAKGDSVAVRFLLSSLPWISDGVHTGVSLGTQVWMAYVVDAAPVALDLAVRKSTVEDGQARQEIVCSLLATLAKLWHRRFADDEMLQHRLLLDVLRANKNFGVKLARLRMWEAVVQLCDLCTSTLQLLNDSSEATEISQALRECFGLGVSEDGVEPSLTLEPFIRRDGECKKRARIFFTALWAGRPLAAISIKGTVHIPGFPMRLQGLPTKRSRFLESFKTAEGQALQRCSALHLAALHGTTKAIAALERLLHELDDQSALIDLLCKEHVVPSPSAEDSGAGSSAQASTLPGPTSAVMLRLQQSRKAAGGHRRDAASPTARPAAIKVQLTGLHLAFLGGNLDALKFIFKALETSSTLVSKDLKSTLCSLCCVMDDAQLLKQCQRRWSASISDDSATMTALIPVFERLSAVDCAFLLRSSACVQHLLSCGVQGLQSWHLQVAVRALSDATIVQVFKKVPANTLRDEASHAEVLSTLARRGASAAVREYMRLLSSYGIALDAEVDDTIQMCAAFGVSSCTKTLATTRHADAAKTIVSALRFGRLRCSETSADNGEGSLRCAESLS